MINKLDIKEVDYEDIEYQKRLIKTFINSVFVYGDKEIIMFNYSRDGLLRLRGLMPDW